MSQNDYTAHFEVTQSPAAVYDAILAVRDWWEGEIEGSAVREGDEFTYRFADFHFSRQRVTHLLPGRKVVWQVTEASINFVADKSEWTGTQIVFEITPRGTGSEVRITHLGLIPQKQCFEACSGGWNQYFGDSLKALIEGTKLKQAS